MIEALALALFDGKPEWSEVALACGVAFLLAGLAATAMGRLVRTAFTALSGTSTDPSHLVTRPVFVTRLITFLLVFTVAIVPMLDAIGHRFGVGLDGQTATSWLIASGLRIAIIIAVAFLVIRIVAGFTARLEVEMARGTGTDEPASDRLRRTRTLGALIKNVIVALVSTIALLMVLGEIGINIVPMLTTAGIAGVALGFGAQWLVRDLIAGFFLILEDQIRVGDIAVINGQGGLVEAINLRTIVLRDLEGVVHVFPNGAITTLANRTRDFAYYLLDVNVDFRQETDPVVEVLRKTAAELQQEPTFRDAILAPLEVLGVDAFKDGLVTIRTRMKTKPHRQFEVGRELRRRVHRALAEAGVDLPPAGVSLRMTGRRGGRSGDDAATPSGGQ